MKRLTTRTPEILGDPTASGSRWSLPAGWCWTPIHTVLEPQADGRLIHQGWSPQCERGRAGANEWGVLRTTSIQPSQYVSHENKRLPAILSPKEAIEVREGDLLMTCAGPRSRCGVACLVRSTRSKLMLSGKMYRFRANQFVILPEFLEAFLQTSYAWREVDMLKTGGSDSGLNLTQDRFRTLMIPLAPLNEQVRICDFLEKISLDIVEGERALDAARKGLETYRRALLKAAVTGELTADWREANAPRGTAAQELACIRVIRNQNSAAPRRGRKPSELPGELGPDGQELPNGWAWTSLETLKVSDQRNGISIAGSPSPPGTKALRLDALTDNGLDLSAVRFIPLAEERVADYLCNPGDLLVSRANGSPELVGRATYIDDINEPVVFPDTIIRYPLGKNLQTGRWAELVWNSPIAKAQIRKLAKTTAGILKISQSDIAQVILPFPPPVEAAEILRRVTDGLSAASDTRHVLDAEASDVQRLRQSVLKAAFEGRLVPQDESDEPAAVMLARIAASQAETPRPRRGRPIAVTP